MIRIGAMVIPLKNKRCNQQIVQKKVCSYHACKRRFSIPMENYMYARWDEHILFRWDEHLVRMGGHQPQSHWTSMLTSPGVIRQY